MATLRNQRAAAFEALRLRYIEQLPVIAAMLLEEDPKDAVSEAVELIEECLNAAEEFTRE